MKKLFALLLLAACLTALTAVPMSAAEKPTYLFITGVENKIDDALVARIKSLGFDVVVKTHDNFNAAADSAGKIAIYISESVSSGNIVDKFNDIAVPLITSESYILDDLGMCGPTSGTDFGSNNKNKSGKVVMPNHPIMKGVSASYKVTTKDDLAVDPCFSIPAAGHALAVDPANEKQAIVSAYEKGDMSVASVKPSYKFPEKRCSIGFHSTYEIQYVSADMWKIFDNAIIWAAGVNPLAPTTTAAAAATTAKAASATSKAPQTFDAGTTVYGLTMLVSLCGICLTKKIRNGRDK